MPIEYEVSQDGKRIDAYPKGVVEAKQAIDYFKKLEFDPSIKPNAIEVVDFSEVTDFKMSYQEIKNIAEGYQKPQSTLSIHATLFLCKSTVAFGIGRMLQTLHEMVNPEHRTLIVKTDAELEEQLSSLRQEL